MIAGEFNGSIENVNIKTGAAIDFAKISGGSSNALVAWQAWTPTLTNWTIGTGGSAGTTARYTQIGKIVFYYIKSILGTAGQSVGTNATFSLPVTALVAANNPIGSLQASGSQLGFVWANTGTTAQLIFQVASGAYVTATGTLSTAPITWAAGDSFTATGFYEAA